MKNFKQFKESKDTEELLKAISNSPIHSSNLAFRFLKMGKKVPEVIIDGICKDANDSWDTAIYFVSNKQPIPEKLIHAIARNRMAWEEFLNELRLRKFKLPDDLLKKVKIGNEQGLI